VVQIGLSEVELILRLPRTALQDNSETFTESQEIVRRVIQSQEASADSADAAAEADGVPALFFHFEIDIDCRLGWAWFDFGVLVLDFLEVSELIQTQQTVIPGSRIKDLAFVDKDFAADDLVAGRRIAAEHNAVDRELPVLIDVHRQVNQLFL